MIKPKPDVIISAYALPGLKGKYKFPIGVRTGDKAEFIESIVSDYFGMSIKAMKVKCRVRENVSARQISMFLMRRYTSLTLKQIGWRFEQDHTSVVYSIKHITDLMETDEVMMHIVQQLEVRVQ